MARSKAFFTQMPIGAAVRDLGTVGVESERVGRRQLGPSRLRKGFPVVLAARRLNTGYFPVQATQPGETHVIVNDTASLTDIGPITVPEGRAILGMAWPTDTPTTASCAIHNQSFVVKATKESDSTTVFHSFPGPETYNDWKVDVNVTMIGVVEDSQIFQPVEVFVSWVILMEVDFFDEKTLSGSG